MLSFRREAEHWRHHGAIWPEALALYNIALLGSELESLGQISAAQVAAMEEEALAAALRAGNQYAEASIRLQIGEKLEGVKALEQFRQALRISERLGNLENRLLAMRAIAQNRFRQGPEHHVAALRILDQAIDLARSHGSSFHLARGLARRASLVELAGSREETVEAWLEAIEAAERLRDLQPASELQARVFSRWTHAYYRLAGYLLDAAGSVADPGPELELAFETIERMRARGLLDSLAGAGAAQSSGVASALHEQREALLSSISLLQAEAFSGPLDAASREALIARIDVMEAEEADLRPGALPG